jgi:hypothetical protein
MHAGPFWVNNRFNSFSHLLLHITCLAAARWHNCVTSGAPLPDIFSSLLTRMVRNDPKAWSLCAVECYTRTVGNMERVICKFKRLSALRNKVAVYGREAVARARWGAVKYREPHGANAICPHEISCRHALLYISVNIIYIHYIILHEFPNLYHHIRWFPDTRLFLSQQLNMTTTPDHVIGNS